ncbi:MAG: oxidoreductase [Candidatus Alcyoniella australis]|nr:oxidoreductase [Candidatus Alcyoniella australis]
MKWTAADIPSQKGRTALITGANSGLGFQSARALAGHGARVVLACRNQEKGQQALDAIRSEHADAQVELAELDLSNLESVRAFAAGFVKDNQRLDLLLNNAGVMVPPYGKTADGFELQIGTNHLGHFALDGLLMPLLLATPNSRVMSVSSGGHRVGKVDFDDLHWERKRYAKWSAYGQSKLANLLFIYELQRRLEAIDAPTIAVAAHPGWASTNLQKYYWLAVIFNPILAQTPEHGAWPSLFAATMPQVRGGEYYGPKGIGELRGHPKRVESNKRSHDEQTASRLWDVSCELTGVHYESLLPKAD